jgi:hypothetical protein
MIGTETLGGDKVMAFMASIDFIRGNLVASQIPVGLGCTGKRRTVLGVHGKSSTSTMRLMAWPNPRCTTCTSSSLIIIAAVGSFALLPGTEYPREGHRYHDSMRRCNRRLNGRYSAICPFQVDKYAECKMQMRRNGCIGLRYRGIS